MKRTPNPRGVALVVVLAFLVLLSALIVSFFSSVTTEYANAKSFSDGLSTRQLADSAVNLVMGQIREASTRENSAWASQPGMIRVYEQDGSVGGFYKLYSSDKMLLDENTIRADGFRPDADVARDWWTAPGLWTDLNSPVKIPNTNANSSEKWIYRFPVFDPGYAESFLSRKGKNLGNVIEGFEIDEDEAVASGAVSSTQLSDLPPEESLARMPVRWIYMLKDGTLTAPEAGTKPGEVRWTASMDPLLRPTKDNPVVGRMAFWTDDETSKVNINTSGGVSRRDVTDFNRNNGTSLQETDYPGSFWDTPRFYTYFERGNIAPNALPSGAANPEAGRYLNTSSVDGSRPGNSLALSQAVNGEFQRSPGHPATNSMGVIFKEFLSSEQIYQITPRIFGGGAKSSMGGINPNRLLAPNAGDAREMVASPLERKGERLYASVDEFLMSPLWNEAAGRVLNDERTGVPNVLTPDLLEKTRFFLTASSRAPDLNLYGRPRVALWPQNTNPAGRTPTDNLLAFCSTIGTAKTSGSRSYPSIKPFYFQRSNPWSGSWDFNNNDILTGTKRNLFLLEDYLKKMTETPVPGFGDPQYSRFGGGATSFSAKYGVVNHAQVLVEMMDYIRTVNLRDSTQDLRLGLNNPAKNAFKFAPYGVVVPSQVQLTSGLSTQLVGMGRFPQISEISLVLYHAGYVGSYREPISKLGDAPVEVPRGQAELANRVYAIRNPSDPTKTVNVQNLAVNFPPELWSDGKKPPLYDGSVNVDNDQRPVPVMIVNGIACPLTPTHSLVKAFILLEWHNPMQGYAPTKSFGYGGGTQKTTNQFTVAITGLDGLKFADQPLNFPSGTLTESMWYGSEGVWNGRNSGGPEGFAHMFRVPEAQSAATMISPTDTKTGKSSSEKNWYQFQTENPILVKIQDLVEGGFGISAPRELVGTDITIRVSVLPAQTAVNSANNPSIPTNEARGGLPVSGQIVKTLQLKFPDAVCPVPTDDVWLEAMPGLMGAAGSQLDLIPMGGGMWKTPVAELSQGFRSIGAPPNGNISGSTFGTFKYRNFVCNALMTKDFVDPRTSYAGIVNLDPIGQGPTGAGVDPGDVKSLAGRIKWSMGFPRLNISRDLDYTDNETVPVAARRLRYSGMWKQIVQPGDTVRSLVIGGIRNPSSDAAVLKETGSNGPTTDPRLAALSPTLYSDGLQPAGVAPTYFPHAHYKTMTRQAQSLRTASGAVYYSGYAAMPFNPHALKTAAAAGKLQNVGSSFRVREVQTQFGNLADGLPDNRVVRWDSSRFGLPELSVPFSDMPLTGVQSGRPVSTMFGPYRNHLSSDIPYWFNSTGVVNANRQAGDFDNGLGSLADGAFAGKPDEGNQSYRRWNSLYNRWDYVYNYYDWSYADPFESFFSPNRQIASAVGMGSLPAGRGAGWQTLCFSPNSAASVSNRIKAPHPGELNPPDHLLLDLFNMPVVEPYAISEPFSTGGRINLNYQIAPFGWIKRSTPIRAALQSVRITAVPASDVHTYKTDIGGRPARRGENGRTFENYRLLLDRDQTVQDLDLKFGQYSPNAPERGFFKSATQICEQFLYPSQQSLPRGVTAPTASTNPNAGRESREAAIRQFWDQYGQLTGDNMREKPYSDLYPRLTTKSNTFTVHLKVQTLKKRPFAGGKNASTFYEEWVEGKDQVLSEYRGSVLIERYINPQDRRFDRNDPDTVAKRDYINVDDVTGTSLESAYKFRVLGVKRFLP
ncbi:MAG: Verru Chthon cassette protein [Verrucomicrobiota bacterium]